MKQSLSEENYLKTVFHLSQRGDQKVSVTAIAEKLGINAASAVGMIKKLKKNKFITYDKSNGVKLTQAGVRVALSIIRSHRLWEVFLLEKLGYSWDRVHPIAEQLEHVNGPDLANRLDNFLGRPDYDPHGDPIPKSDGRMPRIPKTTLSDVAARDARVVVGIKDTTPAYLHYLKKLKITIGTKIKVIEHIKYDGSMVIDAGRAARTTVSKQFAESILVD